MPVSEKEFRELAISVAAIKGERGAWKFIPAAAIGVGLAALSWCWGINNKITAMEQQLADGGNTKLVTELKSPKSLQQLQANLTTVDAQLQTARVNGVKPDQKKVESLSLAVAQVVEHNPELPAAWNVASTLINYRSPQELPNSQSCFAEVRPMKTPTMEAQNDGAGRPFLDTIVLNDCTADIGDSASFDNIAKDIQMHKKNMFPTPVYVTVRFQNAHIVYHGGPLIASVNSFVFVDCTFDFKMLSAPPQPGRAVTQTLLQAKNLADVKVEGI